MKQNEKELKIREYIEEFVPCYTPTMSTETTQKWIDIFSIKCLQRRFDDDNFDNVQLSIGFEFDKKDKQMFEKIWKEIFNRVMNEYITDLKKAKNEEEKEYIKKHGVKRKIDYPGKDKKKNKK